MKEKDLINSRAENVDELIKELRHEYRAAINHLDNIAINDFDEYGVEDTFENVGQLQDDLRAAVYVMNHEEETIAKDIAAANKATISTLHGIMSAGEYSEPVELLYRKMLDYITDSNQYGVDYAYNALIDSIHEEQEKLFQLYQQSREETHAPGDLELLDNLYTEITTQQMKVYALMNWYHAVQASLMDCDDV